MSSSLHALVTLTAAALSSTSALETKHQHHRVSPPAVIFQLRGGALLGVPPTPVGNVASSLGLISGLYCGLQPTAACGAYGISEPSVATAAMTRLLGATNVAQGTLGLAAICGMTASSALAIAQVPLIVVTSVEMIQAAARGRMEGCWARRSPLLLLCSLSLATGAACACAIAVPLAASLGGAASLLCCGLPAALAPRWVAAKSIVPHEEEKKDAQSRGMLQNLGNQLSSFAILQVYSQFRYRATAGRESCGIGFRRPVRVCLCSSHASLRPSPRAPAPHRFSSLAAACPRARQSASAGRWRWRACCI